MLRRINFPLLLGSIIVIFLILVALYPSLFTSRDPLYEERNKFIEYKKDGEWVEEFAYRPIRPNKVNILGTDDAGRDVYARLVYGTRNTLKLAFLIAIFRMILALPLGLMAGVGSKFISGIIKIFNTFFTAIPMLLFSFVVLNIGYFRMLQMDKSIMAFAVVLTIVGWAKLAGMIEDSTRMVMEEDFIEGEIAIGKTKLQIAYQNVLPHIIPNSISLFFKEMGMALFLIAQLAVLFVFVGVTRPIKTLSFVGNYEMGLEPEWGGSLSRIARNLNKYDAVYWMVLYPTLVFSTAIIGMNLFGEGFRIEFQKRNSRVISSIRKTYYHLSPRIFISQIKEFRKYKKPVIIKSLVIMGIIAYFTIPWHPSLYKFDLDQATAHLKELTSTKYEGRAAGFEGGYLAGEYIIDTLKSYGYEIDIMEIPLTYTIAEPETNNEIITPEILSPLIIENGWIKIVDDNGIEKIFHLHEDFTIIGVNKNIFIDNDPKAINYRGIAADSQNANRLAEGEDLIGISYDYNKVFTGLGIALFEFDLRELNQIRAGKSIKYNAEIRLIDEFYGEDTNAYVYRSTIILPFRELYSILESGYREIEINFDYPKIPKYPGRNISAFLPGKGKTKEDPGELIVIGASYDGVFGNKDENYLMTATPAAIALELARTLASIEEPLEKSIEFVFWDNEFEYLKESRIDGSTYYNSTELKSVDMAITHGYYYLDISYPGYNEDRYLNLITLPAQSVDGNDYLLSLDIEKRFKQMNVKYLRFHYGMRVTGALNDMRLNALTSVGLGNPSTEGINSTRDNLENLNFKRMEDIGQTLLDTLTINPRIMTHKALKK